MTRRGLGTAAFSLLLAAATVSVLCATRPAAGGDDPVRLACWLLALACAAWLAVTVLAYLLAIARADLAAARRAARFAPPIVRRLLRTALASALAVAPMTSDTVPRPPVRLHAGAGGRLVPGRARAAPPATTTTTAVPAAPSPAPPSPHRGHRISRGRVHVVRPGDNLWSIARAEIARAIGDEPDDHAVAPYWQRVIAMNRTTLRSGDPSLIFPGEIVALPNP